MAGSDVISATLGTRIFNRQSYNVISSDRPEPYELVRRFGMWVTRCVTINAQAAAAVPIRAFSLSSSEANRNLRGYFKPLDRVTKDYLRSDWIAPRRKAIIRGRLNDMVEVEQHAVLEMLQDINPWSSGYEWREAVYSDLQIFGRHFSHIAPAENGRMSELWRFMPQKMTIVPSPSEFVEWFEYGQGRDMERFPPDEVLWVKLYDPFDPWGGYGPLEAWLRTIDSSHAMAAFQDDLFRNHGSPDFVLMSKNMPTPEQQRSFMASWKKAFGRFAHRLRSLAFIGGDDVKLERLSDSPRELDYNTSEAAKRDQIGQAFGIPKSILTTDDVNRANAIESEKAHAKFGYWPLVQRVEDAINEQLLQGFEGAEGIIIIHDNPIPEDAADRREERASLLASGWSVNRVMELEGHETVEDEAADLPLIAQTAMPLEMLGMKMEQAQKLIDAPMPEPGMPPNGGPPQGDEDSNEERAYAVVTAALACVETAAKTIAVQAASLGLPSGNLPGAVGRPVDPAQLPAPNGVRTLRLSDEWKAFDFGTAENPEGESRLSVAMAEDVSAEMRGLVETVVARLEADESPEPAKAVRPGGVGQPDDYFTDVDIEDFRKRIATVTAPYVRRAINVAGSEALASVLEMEPSFDLENVRVQEYLGDVNRRIGAKLTDSYRDTIRTVLVDGVTEGISAQQIAKNLREKVDGAFTKAWSERISRTEMAYAAVSGTELGWQQSGVVVGKQFVLAPDACEWCQAVASEVGDGRGGLGESRTVDLGRPFFEFGHVLRTQVDGTEQQRVLDYAPDDTHLVVPPVHPHCRCSIRPVLEGE